MTTTATWKSRAQASPGFISCVYRWKCRYRAAFPASWWGICGPFQSALVLSVPPSAVSGNDKQTCQSHSHCPQFTHFEPPKTTQNIPTPHSTSLQATRKARRWGLELPSHQTVIPKHQTDGCKSSIYKTKAPDALAFRRWWALASIAESWKQNNQWIGYPPVTGTARPQSRCWRRGDRSTSAPWTGCPGCGSGGCSREGGARTRAGRRHRHSSTCRRMRRRKRSPDHPATGRPSEIRTICSRQQDFCLTRASKVLKEMPPGKFPDQLAHSFQKKDTRGRALNIDRVASTRKQRKFSRLSLADWPRRWSTFCCPEKVFSWR